MKHPFFDYPTFKYKVSDWDFKKKGLLKRIKDDRLVRDSRDFYNTDRPTNENSYVNFLSDLLHPQLEEFYNESKCRCSMTDAWAVRYDKGDHRGFLGFYMLILILKFIPLLILYVLG